MASKRNGDSAPKEERSKRQERADRILDAVAELILRCGYKKTTIDDIANLPCNSDQGSQFTSPQYTQLLLAHDVRISMDSKGHALDNIFTERLWRTIKYKEVYLKDYASPHQAREELKDYLRFYNEQRVHQSLDYHTPAEVYFAK